MAVTDIAIEKIKRMILSGELKPGDRLPKESDFAKRLGLSRNSLREAVRALALVHVLDVRQGDGTYVTSLEPSLLKEAVSFVADFHRDDTMLQFLHVRRILEPEATALAAMHMSEDDIRELREILTSLSERPTVDELIANDLKFHQRIAAGSGNAVLCSLIEGLAAPTTRARTWRDLVREGAVARTREQHTAIYEAIASRRPDVARSWATVHIASVEDLLRRSLS